VLAGLGFIATEAQIDKSMYGRDVDRREILDGKVAAPASARMLLHELGGYLHEAKLNS
jgi:lipid-binding SYLF domain-containing protein